MKGKILELLSAADIFISGEDISRSLGVSRTAVWKHIKKLRDEGYDIISVTNKGYKLKRVPDFYNLNIIKEKLKNVSLINDVYIYNVIDSTNKEAKRYAIEGKSDTALFISEEQEAGTGRRGRAWISKSGRGIFMSLLLRPEIKPTNASMLTLIAGMSVMKALNRITGLNCMIKWPNDLVLNSKKICGILTEMSAEIDIINYVVIGIGINVNNESFEKEIEDIATSLRIESDKEYNRTLLITEIIKEFEKLYTDFLKDYSLAFMINDYNKACINVGRKVKVEIGGEIIIGKSLNVDETGALNIEQEDGTELIVNSGEVSVRGIYGYID